MLSDPSTLQILWRLLCLIRMQQQVWIEVWITKTYCTIQCQYQNQILGTDNFIKPV